MKYFYSIFFIAILFISKSTAQDLLGMRTGNYSGITGIALNPASMVDSKLKLDINIATFAFNVDNTYIYIPKDSLKFLGFKNLIQKASNNGFTDDYKYGSGDKKGYFGFLVQGPSAMINVGRHAFALFYNARLEFNIDKVNFAAAKLAFEDMDFDPLENDFDGTNPDLRFRAKDFAVNSLAWAEWGGSYGTSVLLKKRHHIKGAVTLKYLQGMGGGYIENPDVNFYMHGGLDDTTWSVDAQNFEYGRVDYWSYGNVKKYKDLLHGKGFGFDLGFVYEHYKKDADAYSYKMDGAMYTDPEVTKYDYKIGFSLIDFGSVTYKDEFSGTFRIDGNNPLYSPLNYGAKNHDWFHEEHESQLDFDTTYSKLFYGKPYESKVSDQFKMNLPSALSFQADVNIWRKLFINATLIKSVKTGKHQVIRPTLLSVTPRYEDKNFEVSLPFSIYNGHSKRLGIAFRFGSIFLGSDIIGALLGFSDLYGTDIYIGTKIMFHKKRIKDWDKDSISDKKDKCKNIAGIASFGGCPDSDGDGIPDSEDQCAFIPGILEFNGCPDKDRDGIIDNADDCPDFYGTLEFKGCPDSDSDKVIDKFDDCPTVYGLKQYKGCPDTDGDSIIDKLDECPAFAGPIIFNGCPDTDGDLIPDHKDDCPLQKGLVIYKGCADTDGDGLPDNKDDCPNVAGPISYIGCPDKDGDGLSDNKDDCPDEVGPISNRGCPVKIIPEEPKKTAVPEEIIPEVKVAILTKEEAEIINKVFKNLNFETGKSIIKSSSFESMDVLVELLKKKTNFKLVIEGHTDNVGKPAANLTLSKNRAAAAEKYLTDRGIDGSRIFPKGYGQTKPIAENTTPDGRALNRRVEFTLVE